jgi:hypothetical protein
MSSPPTKMSRRAESAKNAMFANRHNLTSDQLVSVIASYSDAISTMLDAATAFQFHESEYNKLLTAINNISKKLDEYKRLLAQIPQHNPSHRGGKKTLRKRK